MILTNFPNNHEIKCLADRLTAKVTQLSSADHRTFLKKRTWLTTHTVLTPKDIERNDTLNPVNATLVFAQEEAGTAVCVSPNGVLLTCSHCVAESEDELRWDEVHWLLFASGEAVAAKTVAWDSKRDLAILIIVAASRDFSSPGSSFPHLRCAAAPPKVPSKLLCVGHPGSEDLEASMPGIQTNYDTLVLSTGSFRGLAEGQDAQDNAEIGALMHDCWTYWGHSGAPLVDRRTGCLVGLHSSWDDQTGMRRGVCWEALVEFSREVEKEAGGGWPDDWVWFSR